MQKFDDIWDKKYLKLKALKYLDFYGKENNDVNFEYFTSTYILHLT